MDTSLNLDIYNFKVYKKTANYSTRWLLKIPKRYKCNMILGDLHWCNSIASNFSEEIKFISHKYEKTDYPKWFINSVMRQLQGKSNQFNVDD